MATAQTYKVELRFESIGGCPPDVLESMTVDVLDALDERTSDAVIGAAASASFDPPTLEVDILVAAGSPAELYRRLAEVLQVLEDHTGFCQLVSESYTERTRTDANLIPA